MFGGMVAIGKVWKSINLMFAGSDFAYYIYILVHANFVRVCTSMGSYQTLPAKKIFFHDLL